jgi:glycosyltransferase involved in cell wall biosynthesis
MRIAILTQYYPPETGAPQNRLSDLAKRLHRRGHDVQVLTALPNYPGNEIFPEYIGRANMVEYMDDLPVARVGLYVPRRRTITRRFLNYVSFALNSYVHGPRLLNRFDLLFLESPPLFLGLAAMSLARRFRARLVVNVSDLWPKALMDLGLKAPKLCWKAMFWLERRLYRSAALITVQTQGILNNIKSRFPSTHVLLFPNGVATEAYKRPLDRSGIRRNFGWSASDIVFGYTGVIAPSQAMAQVIEAASRLKDYRHVHFAIFGDGPSRNHLESEIQNRGLSNIRFYGHLPTHMMPDIQAAFDVGLVPLANTDANRGARPSKMFELMAAARPILLCAEGEAVQILNDAPDGPIGIAVPPEQPDLLAEAIRKIVSTPHVLEPMGQRAREYVFRTFNRDSIAKTVEQALQNLLSPGHKA